MKTEGSHRETELNIKQIRQYMIIPYMRDNQNLSECTFVKSYLLKAFNIDKNIGVRNDICNQFSAHCFCFPMDILFKNILECDVKNNANPDVSEVSINV